MESHTRQRLQHTIHFADQSTPTSKARPAGVMGAEIWLKLAPTGSPRPGDPDELTFLAVDTRTPYTADFDGADGGKTAHYVLRWVSTTAEKGAVERNGECNGGGVESIEVRDSGAVPL